MTEEAQRVAIAEACGWKFEKHECGTILRRPDGTPEHYYYAESWRLPDFLHDLNAVHEAEKTLGDMHIKNYVAVLTGRSFVQDGDITRIRCWEALHATAAQRAEAFLRTIGKWEEHDK